MISREMILVGPMFMHYNAALREFPASVVETMKGNKYVTTVHCINSAIQKLSRISPLNPRILFRGSNKMQVCCLRQWGEGQQIVFGRSL